METSNMQNLSRRERQIMNLFFEFGKLTAQEVMEKLPDAPGYATVRSLLRILEEKGHLTHSKSGRQFVYQPTTEPEVARHGSLKHLLKTFFKGSISEAVATFVNHSKSGLTPEELDELEKIVREAKEKQNRE